MNYALAFLAFAVLIVIIWLLWERRIKKTEEGLIKTWLDTKTVEIKKSIEDVYREENEKFKQKMKEK